MKSHLGKQSCMKKTPTYPREAHPHKESPFKLLSCYFNLFYRSIFTLNDFIGEKINKKNPSALQPAIR